MNKKELQAITHAAAKNIKTEDDLKDCHLSAQRPRGTDGFLSKSCAALAEHSDQQSD